MLTARRCSKNVASSRARPSAIRLFVQETYFCEHALDETQTHGIDLDRHADHLPSHRVHLFELFYNAWTVVY